jgi:hypothetical protein
VARESTTRLGREYLFYGWEDLRFPSTILGIQGAGANAPSWDVDYCGWKFADGSDARFVECVVQIPHMWDRGTPLRPHVHFTPLTTGTGTVQFIINYEFATINGTYAFTWAANTSTTYTISANSQYKHLVSSFTEIATTGKLESSILLCRLKALRASDGYAGDIILHEFDIHYLIGKPGTYKEIPGLP